MITLQELNPKNVPLTAAMKSNLEKQHKGVNIVRARYGKPMYTTSGVRDPADHRRIYMETARRKGVPIESLRIPMGSKHLIAAATDFADPSRDLYQFLIEHPEVLEEADVYMELNTVGWVHLQSIPFGSYKPGGTRCFHA